MKNLPLPELLAAFKGNTNRRGLYCEFLALAAFVLDDYEIAPSVGNQACWDVVVRKRPNGPWKTVQIKAVRPTNYGGVTSLMRSNGGNYTREHVDLLALVLPETGAMWLIGPEDFENKRLIRINDIKPWMDGVPGLIGARMDGLPPAVVVPKALFGEANKPRFARNREILLKLVNLMGRPPGVSDENWNLSVTYLNGEGYKKIADSLGLSLTSVKKRVDHLIAKMVKIQHVMEKQA